MKIKIKILSITLVIFLFNPQVFADIYEVNNNKIIILMESGVPLIRHTNQKRVVQNVSD